MKEKELIKGVGGPEAAHDVCSAVWRVLNSLRASGGVPTGADKRNEQYTTAIKKAMSTNKISMKAGKFLLAKLDDDTIRSILNIRGSKKERVGVWLLP